MTNLGYFILGVSFPRDRAPLGLKMLQHQMSVPGESFYISVCLQLVDFYSVVK